MSLRVPDWRCYFRLQTRVKDLDRVELMALRVTHFTGEEASYWLSRMSHFGSATNRWGGGRYADHARRAVRRSSHRRDA